MPRHARHRILYDGCYAHVFSRAIDKRFIFHNDEHFHQFKRLLLEAKQKYPFRLHHYCLMHTHFHMVVAIANLKNFSKALHRIKWAYTKSFNERNERLGPLWQERFKSMLIEDSRYLYACGLYVENNPVEAALVKSREKWPHSSARVYELGQEDDLVDRYEIPDLPTGVNIRDRIFFTKGAGIGSKIFKIQQQEDHGS